MAGDQHDVRVRLGDTGGDGADTTFRHQLHRDARLRIRVLQVVDQLRQVLDRIDVVVRRRRDQSDAGCRLTRAGDPRIDLVPRQLPAFAWLGTLRHFDLQ